jgi:flavodoxin
MHFTFCSVKNLFSIKLEKALIIYHSKTGTTKKFGFAIRDYLQTLDIECKAIPIQNFTIEDLNNINFLFLGCWTSGLFVIMQHPEKEWIEFAKKLPDLKSIKLALFATYKLLSGSMFISMKKHLKPASLNIGLTLKSKSQTLTEQDKLKLKQFTFLS